MATEAEVDIVFEQIGNLLSSSRELTQNILKGLCCTDLLTASQVCHLWHLVANSILKKERRLQFVAIHPSNFPTTEHKVALDLMPPPNEILENFFDHLSIKPAHCIGFASGEWLFRKDLVTKYSVNGSTLSEILKHALPPNCEVALVSASGVVGTAESTLQGQAFSNSENLSRTITNLILPLDADSEVVIPNSDGENSISRSNSPLIADQELQVKEKQQDFIKSISDVGYSVEIENRAFSASASAAVEMEALSLLLIPKQPGVKFKIIHNLQQEFLNTYRPNGEETVVVPPITAEEFNSVCGLKPEEELKALLLFDYDFTKFTKLFVDAAITRQNGRLALGGGLVEVLQQKEEKLKGTMAIAISGDMVKTASFVIPSCVRDAQSLEYWLKELKNIKLPERHSVCFLFSCCGRGSYWYGRNKAVVSDEFCNVETKAFRKLFPNTPIFGFFGDGEVGLNYNDNDLDTSPAKRRKKKRKIYHQYSSVFVFVSFL